VSVLAGVVSPVELTSKVKLSVLCEVSPVAVEDTLDLFAPKPSFRVVWITNIVT